MVRLKRILCILLVFMFLWGHTALALNEVYNAINLEGQENLLKEDKIDAQLNISKYVPFSQGDSKGVFLQVNLKTKLQEGKFPIKTNTIQVEVPIILDRKPDDVRVVSSGTEATKGNKGQLQFTQENYIYHAETGLLDIIVKNEENEESEISWVKDVYDEYLVSFIYYGDDLYKQADENGIFSTIKTKISMEVYESEDVVIEEKVLEGNINLKEKIGDIVNFELNCIDSKIDKGIFYDHSQEQDILYQLQYVAHIGYANLIPYIEFTQEHTDFLKGKEDRYFTYTNYQELKINVENFQYILGENGVIHIVNTEGTVLGVINQETKQEEGYYIFDCSLFQRENLIIKTSQPIQEGKLEINAIKKIPSENLLNEQDIKDMNLLSTAILGKTIFSEQTIAKNITLEEPVSKATIELKNDNGNSDFSTAIEYKDVEARVVLHTSDYSYALFQNPTLEITFPSNMKNIVIKDIHLLLKDELEIEKVNVREENGSEIFTIKLKGQQTEYQIGNALQGTNLVMSLDFQIDLLSPTQTKEITMVYTNENVPMYEQTNDKGQGITKTDVHFIAPNGIISASSMTGYNDEESVSTIQQETITKLLPVNEEAKKITFSGDIVNNYDHAISKVKVLGRLPFAGNKKIGEQTELGSNVDTKMVELLTISKIDQTKVDIYYSKQEEPNIDLNDIKNEWTKTPDHLEEIKCYLIVLKENMSAKQQFQFSYTVEVPEKLEFGKSSYTVYQTYYTNEAEEGTFEESRASAILGITTGEGPKLSVKLSSNVSENAELKEGKIVKFKAIVKNAGEVKAEDVKLYLNLPKGVELVILEPGINNYTVQEGTQFIYPLGDIAANTEVVKEYELQLTDDFEREMLDLKKAYIDQGDPSKTMEERIEEANRIFVLDTYQMKIENIVSVTESRIETSILSNPYLFYKVKGNMKIVNVGSVAQEVSLKRGDKVKFVTRINNLNENTVHNAKIWTTLPEGIKIINAYIQKNGENTLAQIDYHDNQLQAVISKMDAFVTYTLVYEIEVMDYIGDMKIMMYGNGDGITNVQESNELIYEVSQVNLEVKQTSVTSQYVKEGDNISYRFTIQNTGNFALQNVNFIDEIPDGVSFVEAKHGYQNETKTKVTVNKTKKFNISIYSLRAGEIYEIDLIVKANTLSEEQTKEIINQGILKVQGNESVVSNSLTHYIEYDPSQHGKEEIGRYSILGCVWNDENRNGRREDNEAKLSEVEVMLFDRKTNHVVTDIDNHQKKVVKTDSNGNYQFSNLVKGDYFVVFHYDAARYYITDYQKNGVEEFLNSDAISAKVVLDEVIENVGMTDKINLTNSNTRNIDLGLYDAEKFDLKLDKYIRQITLTTPTIGTKTYSYDSNIAKIEILGKNLNKSNIAIEYKIVITNEGAVPGYVKKIVDYLPDTLQFKSEMNRNWYQGNDNHLYCTELENVEIKPGESKEVSLIVTKKITEGSLGTIRNEAEIYETYNVQGLQDIDSIPGNRIHEEDDMSFADLVLSLVTGKIVAGVIISTLVLLIVFISCYQIKKRVLTQKEKKG